MLESDPSPSGWRIAVAFAGAPAIASLLFACYEPGFAGSGFAARVLFSAVTYALLGAYPATLLFGLPTFLVLRRRVRPTVLRCALVGAAVAATPWLLLSPLPAPDYAFAGGGVTALDGQMTTWGWIRWAMFVTEVAVAGGLGGLVFWLMATVRPRRGAARTW